jgi:hypothetical protein
MKLEHREKLGSAEWRQVTSRGSMVVRRIPPPEHSHTSQTPATGAKLKVTVYYVTPRSLL